MNNKYIKYLVSSINAATTCPHCGNNGTFEAFNAINATAKIQEGLTIQEKTFKAGIMRCPNVNCLGIVFFFTTKGGAIIHQFPPETISFDKTDIPKNVLNAFKEAILSHSNECYIAAGIMIRKTLEEICHEQGITAPNLFKRLEKLNEKIVIPQELKDGMQELRLLGNDAAHIEAQTFGDIGKDEIEISIEFTKEILKAVYQYNDLLGRLRKLKEDNNTPSPTQTS